MGTPWAASDWYGNSLASGTHTVYVSWVASGESGGREDTNSVTLTVTQPTPTFTLAGPTSGTFTVGQKVPIQWTAGNVAAGSTVALCYDTDTRCNGNETWIKFGQAGANGNGSYSWDTTGVAPGTYYIGGYLYSGGKPYYSHLTQSITIQAGRHRQHSTLTAPTSGTFTAGQTVPIQWTAGNVAAGSTVNLCSTRDTAWNGNETWIKFGQ